MNETMKRHIINLALMFIFTGLSLWTRNSLFLVLTALCLAIFALFSALEMTKKDAPANTDDKLKLGEYDIQNKHLIQVVSELNDRVGRAELAIGMKAVNTGAGPDVSGFFKAPAEQK